ncbi:hypothetical protein ACH9L7_00990 [Haloferax sp. S1W]|uniref:hypothetical protein n=1 Tax=Haloferax sp. S1W TaxID=3377110 RepID=UPI0037C72231
MNQLRLTRGLVTLCAVFGLLAVGVGPAAADELAAGDGGDATTCDRLHTEAYDEIDALAARLPVDHVLEGDVLAPIQAVVTQLNYDVKNGGCADDST